MACGTHLSCGIPIERCSPQSEVGASDKGKEVLGRISGFWLLLLLGKTTKSRHPHRQRSRQNCSALICQGTKGLRSAGLWPPRSAQACKKALNQWCGLRPHSKSVCSTLNIIAAKCALHTLPEP